MPKFGDSGIFERYQAEALRDAGARVAIFSGGVITTRYLGQWSPYRAQDEINGIPVIRAHRRAWLPARWEQAQTVADKSYKRLRPLIIEYIRSNGKPDLVHAHNLAAGGLIAFQIFKDFGIPYVVTEHTGSYASDLSALKNDAPLLELVVKNASGIIAVGTQLANNIRQVFGIDNGNPVSVVPNVVDPGFLAKELKVAPDPFRISAIGNLIRWKNYDLLLRAFALAALPSDAHLVIGGNGPERRRLQTLATQLGLLGRVEFRGQLSRDDVVQVLQESHMFAHPSNGESFGVVLIEAMALGIPVLATKCGGPQDIITPDVGLLSPAGNLTSFADGLSTMYSQRLRFNPALIRESCRARFGAQVFADRMLAIYADALQKSG